VPPKKIFHIEIQIDPQFTKQIDEQNLRSAVNAALNHQDAPSGASITLVIAGDQEMRRLNRQFRQVDAPTDVLAFPTAGKAPFVKAPGQPIYLGDIIISLPRAAIQAAAVGHNLAAELALLAVHGTLHLLGHNHATPQEKEIMWAAQETILARSGLE